MEQLRKTRVLITNDDGVGSVNLHALALALSEVSDVYVFAPEDEQSGVGHAFTIRRGLRIQHVEAVPGKAKLPYEVYSVSGTPADCVKFAVGHFANYGLDDNTIVITPKGEARENKGGFTLNKDNGLIGYPNFTEEGIEAVCFFNPNLQIGAVVNLETIVPKATGQWKVTELNHTLEINGSSEAMWRTSFSAVYNG